jgi:predicted transposase YdaD
MSTERVRALARQFPENGLKQLLQQPTNVRELLTLARAPLRDRIDFNALTVDPTTYVTADYRHVSSDLVLTAPLRPVRGKRRRRLSLTILLEHQSEPDRLMILRVLDYLVQIWKSQVRLWGQEHRSPASVKLQPILPWSSTRGRTAGSKSASCLT